MSKNKTDTNKKAQPEDKPKNTKKDNMESVVAKSNDGTVQISFTIDKVTVKKELDKTAKILSETLEIKGFRKGKAPLEKVLETVDKDKLIQNTLNRIVPEILEDTFQKHNLKPIMFPRVELLKADSDSDWQLRAVTAEKPNINLGDYKNMLKSTVKSSAIWTPEKAKTDSEKAEKDPKQALAEKEQEVIKALLANIKFDIPKILIDEEVNARLSKLLEQIENLGLTLDTYLKSTGKDAEKLKSEYKTQAEETLKLEFILNEISNTENVTVTDSDLEPYVKQIDKSDNVSEENRKNQIAYLRTVLRKRKSLEHLLNLV